MNLAEGKSVIVTGAGSGIGRATALMLGEAGMRVTVADLNEASAAETASLVTKSGGIAQFIGTDIADEQQVTSMVDYAMSSYDRLDGAANCAGRPHAGVPFHELTMEQWQSCVDVNMTGVFLCLKHQISAMLPTGGGSIVVVSSSSALKGIPLMGEYAAPKAGVLALVRTLAHEYADRGIRVNAILPGPTETAMLRTSLSRSRAPDPEALAKSRQPIARISLPSEQAAAITWLLSEGASYVTGVSLPVDGGQTSV